MNLDEQFKKYLSDKNISLNDDQSAVAKMIVEQMSGKLGQFFRARRTGVSFVFKVVEDFARDPKVGIKTRQRRSRYSAS